MPGYRIPADKYSKYEVHEMVDLKNDNNYNMKSIFKSRTVWLAFFQGVAGIMTAVLAVDPSLSKLGWVLLAKSIIDFMLRLDTSTKVV